MKDKKIFENVISVTDLRRDIDSLTKRLDKNRYTYVLKNQDPLFVAVEPELFEELQNTQDRLGEMKAYRAKKIKEAIDYFKEVREKAGSWPAAETVIRLRDEEPGRWKKKS